MPENTHLRFLLQLLYVVLAVFALWIMAHFLLPWLLPFLLALALSTLLEPLVLLLTNKLALKRAPVSGLCTLTLAILLITVLTLFLSRSWYELGLLLGRLPTLLSGLPSLGSTFERWAYSFVVALPTQFQEFFQESIQNIISQGISLPNRFYDWLSGYVLSLITALPNLVLFLFTTLLATYFTSASRPTILSFLWARIPQRWRPQLQSAYRQSKVALIGWLKAQGLLILITLAQLAVGFLILKVEFALLLAAMVAVVDALPVFGTGAVLLPWALFSFFSGDRSHALGLVILYATIVLVRNVLEPRLVGEKLGLHPLVALLAIYLGFQIFGVLGMIFAPLLTVLGRGILRRFLGK